MTESTTARRARLDGLCDRISSAGSKNDLIDAIDDALGVAPPEGDPVLIESLGKRYRGQADNAMKVHDRTDAVSRKGLPDVWAGDTSVLASDAVDATARAAEQMAEALRGGGNALITFSDCLEAAQKKDSGGRTKLRDARAQLGDKDGFFDDWHEDDGEEAARKAARSLATTGVDELLTAASDADDAARQCARDLNKYASEARAGKMGTDELSAVDRIALADTANVGGDPELNEILSANDLERSGRAMENMTPADRARMEKLLADAATPQEKAYLMKALASGYSVDEVAEFGGKIHGKDEVWLREHLAPVSTNSATGQEQQTFGGKLWDQDGATCVPSSTVTARAMVDPVYALELTGGPDGQDNSDEHFRERLTDEQMRMHEEGDGSNSGWWWDRHPSGMDSDGQVEISDKELSPHTGDSYESHDMNSADDRRDVLTDVEESVAEGKPVPINIEGEENGDWVGHGMMIVGQEGDMLQIYNPWGTTTWVSEDDFINGDLSAATDDRFSKDNNGDVNRVYIDQD
ncbi:peptidoglycan-binding protein [Streptomyces sp. VRA16 Mangrove soil]|uniref:peptidoglycan-binding protein n=1 Tax=Streptomyces sp. VRA16 Mangrove soil TaxID=2817434 RepID=UPI001A9D2068|nr:peptidoglycan-binding protein [Streptomyces sp. VRA16 Mangrove soil]MBO1334662.1 peptidoglycan-binding protein [Streptomyces sp. VRA16 Mangrove soil]